MDQLFAKKEKKCNLHVDVPKGFIAKRRKKNTVVNTVNPLTINNHGRQCTVAKDLKELQGWFVQRQMWMSIIGTRIAILGGDSAVFK